MYLHNNLKFDINIQHVIGDVQYPHGWFLDAGERAKVGIVEVPDPVWPDPDLYIASQNPDGSLTITPRSAEEIAARTAARAQEAQDVLDVASAKGYAKLQALRNMTPAQVSTWVDGNVTNLAQAQDAIKTLAVAVCVLARRL